MTYTTLPKRQQGDFLYNAMFVRIQLPYSPTTDKLKGWGNAAMGVLANGNAQGWDYQIQDTVFDPNTTAPPINTPIVDWAFTNANLYVVYSNGWVYSAGRNDYGQLGHGDNTLRPFLKRIDYFVNNGLSVTNVWAAGAASATAGGGCVYFAVTGGSSPLYACGAGAAGNLANATSPTGNLSSPAPCSGLAFSVVDVQVSASGGVFSAFVLDANGNVNVAGLNNYGQLGTGSYSNVSGAFTKALSQLTPSPIPLANISSVSVTDLNALALDSNGNVWTTGYNAYGQLGQGNTTTLNLFTKIQSISGVSTAGIGAGPVAYAYALTSSGVLYTWGYNGQNNLFKNNTAVAYSPTTTVLTNGYALKVFFPKGDQLGGSSQLFVQTSDNKIIYAGLDNGQQGIPTTAVPGAYKVIQTPQFDSIEDIFVHGTGATQRLFVLGSTWQGLFQLNLYACGSNQDSICNGGFVSNSMPPNVDCALIPIGNFSASRWY